MLIGLGIETGSYTCRDTRDRLSGIGRSLGRNHAAFIASDPLSILHFTQSFIVYLSSFKNRIDNYLPHLTIPYKIRADKAYNTPTAHYAGSAYQSFPKSAVKSLRTSSFVQ